MECLTLPTSKAGKCLDYDFAKYSLKMYHIASAQGLTRPPKWSGELSPHAREQNPVLQRALAFIPSLDSVQYVLPWVSIQVLILFVAAGVGLP